MGPGAVEVLTDFGFEAVRNPVGDEITLRPCPYAELVHEHPVIGDPRRAPRRGAHRHGRPVTLATASDVFPRPGLCVAHLRRPDADPEWTVELPRPRTPGEGLALRLHGPAGLPRPTAPRPRGSPVPTEEEVRRDHECHRRIPVAVPAGSWPGGRCRMTATVTKQGGRDADSFYRVPVEPRQGGALHSRWTPPGRARGRSTSRTGYTWETQQTDYPSVGSTSAARAPRLPARWGPLSGRRLTHAGALPVHPRRAARRLPGGEGRQRRRPGQGVGGRGGATRDAVALREGRGKGGLVRASWSDTIELVSAAHVHTIDAHGPDRVFGFSPGSRPCPWPATPPAPVRRALSAGRC